MSDLHKGLGQAMALATATQAKDSVMVARVLKETDPDTLKYAASILARMLVQLVEVEAEEADVTPQEYLKKWAVTLTAAWTAPA